MKLFAKYNRVNITATIITFVAGAVAFYFVLNYILLRQLDGSLKSEQQEITEFVTAHGALPEFENTRQQWITAEKAEGPVGKKRIVSIPVFDARHNDYDEARQLVFSIPVQGNWYTVTVTRSQAETEDLLKLIIIITLAVIIVILVSNYIINRWVISRLWRPFYHTIDSIKQYSVKGQEPLTLPAAGADEIVLLNDTLNQMAQQVYRDYQALKDFTGNASHEMQTPLAVIRGKIEALMQSESLGEQEIAHLQSLEDAAKKLARLHQSLLLLTRLENRQFTANDLVDMEALVLSKAEEWRELVEARGLNLVFDTALVTLSFHHHLAEILVNNLLGNAIKYTPEEGDITIMLHAGMLAIANTAGGEPLDDVKVFTRFYKAGNNKGGTGLGLAIVKEICNLAGFSAGYIFKENRHVFTIHFNA